jgi:glycosyltransferase involved in cell wall biosynthesis
MVNMNILFFCQLYPPAIYGGGEYIFFQWARELAARDHKVFAIAQKLKGTADFEKLDGINVFRTGSPIDYQGVLPISLRSNLNYVSNAFIKGLSIIRENKIDLIHSNTYIPALAGFACAKIFRKPHIVTFHDVYYLRREEFWANWGSQDNSKGLVSLAGPSVEQLLMRLPNTVFHTVSKTSMKDLMSCGVNRVVVVPNGIDITEYPRMKLPKHDDFQFIFIGRLVFYKNLETVIKAFKKVVEKVPVAKFVIVGDGPFKPVLTGLVENLGLDGKVIFVGNIPHEEKVRLLNESSFLVHPSVVEGFGIVILEAYACSKPVIVSSVEPLTEIVEDGKDGYIVSPFNIDAWADKIIYLLNNPNKAVAMGFSGRKKLERSFTIPLVVDKIEALYSTLVTH